MGFLDKLKKIFDSGGISADLQAPDQFRWDDKALPVSLTLTGHESEPRTVTSIVFRLQEDEVSNQKQTGASRKRDGITFERSEPIELAAGESKTIEVDFPLSIAEGFDQAAAAGKIPGWLSTVAKIAETGMKLAEDTRYYRISATPKVEGAKMSKSASQRIRRMGKGDISIGGVDVDFN